MMRFFDRNATAAFLVVALAFSTLLTGCQRGPEPMSRNPMTTLSPRLQPLFEKTRTVCFGRFLMQVPATATVVYGPADVETPIEFFEGQGDKVAEHMAARLLEVKNERRFLLKTDIQELPLFGKVIDGIKPGQKIVFGSKDGAGYAVHSFIPVGKDLFVQYINSILPDEDIVSVFNHVASHLQSRSEEEIPAAPGMCIEGGFVQSTQEREWVRIGIRLKEFPDVHLSVEAHKNLDRLREGSSPKLLREQAKEMAVAAGLGPVFSRTKILREHERQLGTWKGEEQALRTPAYKDDLEAHDFRFHSMGALHDPLQPELEIRFNSGVKDDSKAKVKPSITDEEALALWDKLITSIRVRQPSDATQAPRARPPIASVVPTGGICPETGWWECTESRNIEGGMRRSFKAGERMPHVVLLGEPGLWKKITGSGGRQIETIWKLVDYVDDTATPSGVTGDLGSRSSEGKPPEVS
jgi:hypothetical protein